MEFTNSNLIEIVRGDTLPLSIERIRNGEDSYYTLSNTDKIYMEVKKDSWSKTPLIRKEIDSSCYDENGALNFTIFPSETSELDCISYVYDIRLVQDENNIYTIIPYSPFIIKKNVTDLSGVGING